MKDKYWLLEMTDFSVYLVRNPVEELVEQGIGEIRMSISAECVKLEKTSFNEARKYDRENVEELFNDMSNDTELLFGHGSFHRAFEYK